MLTYTVIFAWLIDARIARNNDKICIFTVVVAHTGHRVKLALYFENLHWSRFFNIAMYFLLNLKSSGPFTKAFACVNIYKNYKGFKISLIICINPLIQSYTIIQWPDFLKEIINSTDKDNMRINCIRAVHEMTF